jgi:hypothetical protein
MITMVHSEVLSTQPALADGEVVDAIVMPAAFGVQVQAELEIMMLAGAVVIDPEQGWYVFLTEPAGGRSAKLPTDLLVLGVRPGSSSWVSRPDHRQPAIWSVVIGAARRVAYRSGRG